MGNLLEKFNLFNIFQALLQKDFVVELENEEEMIRQGKTIGRLIDLPEILRKQLHDYNENMYDIEIRQVKKNKGIISLKWRKFRNALLMYGTDQIIMIERDNLIMFIYYIKDNLYAILGIIFSILLSFWSYEGTIKIVIIRLLTIISIFYIFYTFVRKYLLSKLNFILISPEEVYYYRTKGFWGLKSSRLNIETIDKVNFTKIGLFQSLLNTGNILLWQAGTHKKADAELFGTKNPEILVKFASEILEEAKKLRAKKHEQ